MATAPSPTWPMAAPQALAAGSQRQALLFVTVVVASSVLLQRFGLPAGEKAISVVGPIGLGFAALGLMQGTLCFSKARLPAFLALCLLAMLGMAWHQAVPGAFPIPPSLQSVLQFLILSSFATLSFSEPLPERVFFRRVNAVLGFVAAAGIVQFVAQFAGVRLFSFRGIVPNVLLFENGYNLQIPTGIGSLLKSNGFFLLEPSIFSQFMALALIIEAVSLRRLRFLLLFTGGLVLSMAGTGWLVLAAFLASTVFSMGKRGVLILFAGLVGLALVGAVVLVAAPDVAAALGGRLDEISRPSTSGHLRFITPFWVVGDVLAQDPSVFWLGMGGGVVERLTLAYEYTVNTPVKIMLEYGLPALLAYVALLSLGRKTRAQWAVLAPCLVLLLLTGGYQQLPPVLFPVLLVMSVARLREG